MSSPAPSVPSAPSVEPDGMHGCVDICPIRIAPRICALPVNLLLTEKDSDSHDSAIKNLDRLIHAQYTKSGYRYFHCYRCLHCFIAKKGETSQEKCRILRIT